MISAGARAEAREGATDATLSEAVQRAAGRAPVICAGMSAPYPDPAVSPRAK
jgi:hypothetical protein